MKSDPSMDAMACLTLLVGGIWLSACSLYSLFQIVTALPG
jgi:hypothetical protein